MRALFIDLQIVQLAAAVHELHDKVVRRHDRSAYLIAGSHLKLDSRATFDASLCFLA
jgi:hypothetical protein